MEISLWRFFINTCVGRGFLGIIDNRIIGNILSFLFSSILIVILNLILLLDRFILIIFFGWKFFQLIAFINFNLHYLGFLAIFVYTCISNLCIWVLIFISFQREVIESMNWRKYICFNLIMRHLILRITRLFFLNLHLV